jgi:fibrillarin-like rRNA methylase
MRPLDWQSSMLHAGTVPHLYKALVCAVDLIRKDVEQHLTVTVSLQVPAAAA